ncbi:hypothetical protein F5972_08650 [Microbispora cellulosiformans]|uniref:Uncharacterized protein n=1 Tax=Microbispora cellulosiformans TaxID=2614688 RepID=A0A5J5K6E2_9ACTN|nr:hypothetical protein [Microbispora cellulosiformans]KAA9379710.1 hypothetical protein F5972_08650 [Microbispora cellulosiformans]
MTGRRPLEEPLSDEQETAAENAIDRYLRAKVRAAEGLVRRANEALHDARTGRERWLADMVVDDDMAAELVRVSVDAYQMALNEQHDGRAEQPGTADRMRDELDLVRAYLFQVHGHRTEFPR